MNNKRGFTLLELIVTITIAAILGTVLVTFMGTGLTESVQPIIRTQNQNRVIEAMDRMTADYKKLLMTDTSGDPLNTFRLAVISNNNNPSSSYGSYTLEDGTPRYIIFDSSGNEQDDTTERRILRVTISQGDQRMTAIFVK